MVLVALALVASLVVLGVVLLRALGSSSARISEQMRVIQEQQTRLERSEGMQMLNQSVLGLRNNLDSKIREVNDRLNSAAEAYTRVQHGLGRLDRLGESVDGLQAMLGSQKLRGGLGEQMMTDVLKDFVPQGFRDTQVTLRSGARVDAVIKTSNGMVPIDAKFPLESYVRATKAESQADRDSALNELYKNTRKHVRDIASKYICPGETVNFAIMYVPSEAVFEAIQEDSTFATESAKKRVFAVSPTTFCPLLSLIMLSLEGERLADSARSVMDTLHGVKQLAGKFDDQLRVASTHVRNAGNALDQTNSRWGELRSSIDNADSLELEGDEITELESEGPEGSLESGTEASSTVEQLHAA